jgi:LacI family transcriptional regulator
MPSTIKDIAKKLNISVSTVSYALNGGPRPVPDTVRDKVLAAAKELDYRPNRLARSLITRRSYSIGVVPTVQTVNMVMSPYVQVCLNGIVNQAEDLSYDVLLYTRFDQSQVEKMANTLLDGRTDGLVFLAPRIGSRLIDLIAANGLPFVVTSSEHYPAAPTFRCDNALGVDQAVRHLVGLGHKRIAHIAGMPDMEDSIVRREGFLCATRGLGLEIPEEWIVDGDFHPDGGRAAFAALMKMDPRPTAVFCANDEMAIGALAAAYDLGFRIPEDVSIVGFDDAPISHVALPTLTTVRQPIEAIGAAAVRALAELIDGCPKPKSAVFPTELIARASSAAPMED